MSRHSLVIRPLLVAAIGGAIVWASLHRGQKTSHGYYNLACLLKRVTRCEDGVLLCGTCMDAQGMGQDDILEGAHRSTVNELAETTLAADRVLAF